jgi:hypothetical protein
MLLGGGIPRIRGALVAVSIAIAVAGACSYAFATVVVSVGFDDQCRQADRIFVGTVDEIESRRNPSAPAYFETIVSFTVERRVAGDVPDTVSLRFTGGQIGNERQSIDGMPEFVQGERYVVFTEAAGGTRLVSEILGFNQGLYRIVDRPDVARTVVRDRRGRPIDRAALSGSAREASALDGLQTDPDLDAFVSAIHAVRPR